MTAKKKAAKKTAKRKTAKANQTKAKAGQTAFLAENAAWGSTTSEGHAHYSPSASSRWLECTASMGADMLEILKGMPREKSGPAAQRGTRLHDVAEKCLELGPKKAKPILARLPDDERDAIVPYIDLVNEREGTKFYEQKVVFIEGACFGTADAVVLNFDEDELEVIDLKTGTGVAVDAAHNTQLVLYGLGALLKYGKMHDWKRVRMTISQAATGNPDDSWSQSVDEMLRWADMIRSTIIDIENGDVAFSPSKSSCRWCPFNNADKNGKALCPEVENMAQHAAKADFAELPDDDEPESAELWAEALNRAEVLGDFAKMVISEAKRRMLEQNMEISGKKVVAGRSTRAWTSLSEAEGTIGDLVNEQADPDAMEIYTPGAFKSPKQIEDIFKGLYKGKTHTEQREEYVEKINELVTKSAGPPTIADVSDSRPVYNANTKAKKDFAEPVAEADKSKKPKKADKPKKPSILD